MRILALSTNYSYHQDLLTSLKEKGIEIAFATSHFPDEEMQKCKFYIENNTQLINGRDFYKIEKLQKIVSPTAPALDADLINYFQPLERDFYTISDRYSYFPTSFRYRKRILREAMRYWLDFFAKNKIDAVYSICSPHNLPDYVAFFMAQYLGIKTIMTNDVMINNHVLVTPDYRHQFKVPADFMAGKSADEVKSSICQTLAEQAFAESIEITYAKVLNDNQLGQKNLNQNKFEKAKVAAKERTLLERATKFIHAGMLKPKFKSAFAMNGEYSDLTRRLIRIACGIRLNKTKKSYEELAVYPDFSKKYVYFAMHLNPERTTQPEAEVFEDHLLAIEILAKSTPDDWVIYVKENPSQNGRKLNLVNGKHYRDKTDYQDFTRNSKVKLIRQDVKTVDLIQNATIISTLKGSVGWEAINAGKACVIFSNAWYSACRSAIRVDNVDDCKKAIQEVLAKSADEVQLDKLKFFSYMQNNIVIGSMGGHSNLELASVPYDRLVTSLAEKLSQLIAA